MSEYTYGLHDYIRVARERWRTIAVITLLVLFVALAVTAAKGEAGSSGDEPDGPGEAQEVASPAVEGDVVVLNIFPIASAGEASVNMESERLVLLSERVLMPAAETLEVDVDVLLQELTIVAVPEASAVAIVSQEVNGTAGQEVGRAVASAYLDERSDVIQRRFDSARATLERQIEVLQGQAGTDSQSLPATLRMAALEVQLAELESEAAAAEPGEALTSAAYSEALLRSPSFSQAFAPTPSPEPVAPAAPAPVPEVAETPSGRPWARNSVAGVVLGLILGYGVALMLDVLSSRFRSPREAEEQLGLPVLAQISRDPDQEDVSHLATQVEKLLQETAGSSLAWVDITDSSERAFSALAARLEAGGVEVEVLDSRSTSAISRTQAQEILRTRGGKGSPILVNASGDAGGTSLAWAGACDAALVVIDLEKATREQTDQQVGNLKRAGTTPAGLVLVL